MPEFGLGGAQSASQTNVINPSQVNSNNDANSQINSAELGHRDVQQVSNDPVSVSWQDKFSNACTSIKNSIVTTLSNVKDDAADWCDKASEKLADIGEAISDKANSIFNSIKNMISSNNNGLSIDTHINIEAGVSIVVEQNDQPGAGMGPGAPVNNMMAMDDVPNQIQANIEAMMNQGGEDADVNIVANGPQLSREGSQEGILDDINLGDTAGYIDDVVNNMMASDQNQMSIDENIAQQAQAAIDIEGQITDMGEQAAIDFANMPTNFAQQQGEGEFIDVDAMRDAALKAQSEAKDNMFQNDIKSELDLENLVMDDIIANMDTDAGNPAGEA